MGQILQDDDLQALLYKQVKEILLFLIKKCENFSVIAFAEYVEFNPMPPDEALGDENIQKVEFELNDYTFGEVQVKDDKLFFYVNYRGLLDTDYCVGIPLYAIDTIYIDDAKLIFSNPCIMTKEAKRKNQVRKSKSVFKSNPQNQNFFK